MKIIKRNGSEAEFDITKIISAISKANLKMCIRDSISIVSLSSGILGEDFVKFERDIGLKRLGDMRVRVKFMPNSLRGVEYLKEMCIRDRNICSLTEACIIPTGTIQYSCSTKRWELSLIHIFNQQQRAQALRI